MNNKIKQKYKDGVQVTKKNNQKNLIVFKE